MFSYENIQSNDKIDQFLGLVDFVLEDKPEVFHNLRCAEIDMSVTGLLLDPSNKFSSFKHCRVTRHDQRDGGEIIPIYQLSFTLNDRPRSTYLHFLYVAGELSVESAVEDTSRNNELSSSAQYHRESITVIDVLADPIDELLLGDEKTQAYDDFLYALGLLEKLSESDKWYLS